MTTPSTAELARQLFYAGRWADAARAARLATQQEPASADECAMIFGMSKLRLGRAAEARGALEFALAKNPRSATLRLACAEAALSTGDDLACQRALDAITSETVGVEELRAALRRAQCELPANDALACLSNHQRVTPGQWESAIRLLLEVGRVDDAERLRSRQPASTSVEVSRLVAARTATARRDAPGAVLAWRSVVAHDASHRDEAFEAMLALDAAEDAAVIAAEARQLSGDTSWLARLALYGGRLDDARSLLPPSALTRSHVTTAAALALLLGKPAEARDLLVPVERAPGEALLYVEALRRTGQVAEALRVFQALSPLALARVAASPLCRIAIHASANTLDPENRALLRELRDDFPDLAARYEEPVSFATAAIDSLSGNWGVHATRPNGSGSPRWQPIGQPMRQRVAALRDGLRGLPLEAVIEQYEALEAQEGAHPLIATYGAELLLWWGDYARAEAWLARALALDQHTRWAYIGTAILQNVTGHPEAALATIARQRELLSPLANSLGCTAEAHLLLGDAVRAQADYEAAIEAHPTRMSAWLGLAAAQHQQGASHEAALARVQQLTPVFFRQWQRETADLGTREQLSRGLAMLQGNRGSDLITWRTLDGRFHGENTVR